ncbi:nucleolar protein 4-like b isoform X2 [Brienomyrus brachyistius]|uniref:nucleolar protein 4-like b isoform X2 n=1 Tax=Brienomyrus brachyistius TaxID=42636 RepID=UPI0020B2E585|nr:nucleolar protein 4-like b isoform X2 [Brienomyrus brachyistius]
MSSKRSCSDLTRRSRSPVASEAEMMFSQFQDWCLRTYGDSGKTKTVTRRKYNKILQTLLQGDEADGVYAENSHINAKFKFWVKSKGFQLGGVQGDYKKGASGKPVLYVPIKAACVDGVSAPDGAALKRVAVVEDFFDIIYAMHVEVGADPAKAPKHAGQKKTYKAIAETYAFLPREAVTRFLMSCGECQKRMHINPSGAEFKENDRPTSLIPDLIDYNMPLTTAYLKQMKMGCMNTNEQDESSVSSEDFDMSEPAWLSADQCPTSDLSPGHLDRMHSPLNAHKEEDGQTRGGGGGELGPIQQSHHRRREGCSLRRVPRMRARASTQEGGSPLPDDSSSESGSGNGMHSLTPPSAGAAPSSENPSAGPYSEANGTGAGCPLDFSITSSSSSCDDRQPANLPPGASLGPFQPDPPDGLRRKYPSKPTHLDGHVRDYSNKTEPGAEDLTVSRVQAGDDDDDDHDDHDDSDKINDTEGVDPERLKAFNMFVRLFVDENLDRMVPISKQPKEKIQAIIESCSRQFPEFQERARKRIRTYLKSCRRMKKNGMETRPTPPHLTSAMAENILAAACESETRKAAKRLRLDTYQAAEEQIALDKPGSRELAPLTHPAYSLAASTYPQDQLYINGGLSYSYRGYGGLGASMQHPVSLTTGAAQSNGPTDLSMKSLASNSSSSSSNSHGRGGGVSVSHSSQLSPTEITAVRQLIAGYRESAAFLLRSADELESLILQQN